MGKLWSSLRSDRPVGRQGMARLAGAVLVGLLCPLCRGSRHEKVKTPPPDLRISTVELDYHPLSSFYLMGRTSSSSLDFIDGEHLLFTFRTTGLLKRLPECQPDDEDQLIRALVIHLPEGKVERSAEWRMHDRGRYLWALPKGRFLVRQRDTLSMVDSSLELQPFLQSDTALKLVKLSPDARLLLLETELEQHTPEVHERLMNEARLSGSPPPAEDVQISILRTEDRRLVARTRTLKIADLALIAEGYLEALPAKANHWMVRYLPFHGEPSVVTDVESACRPIQSPFNATSTLIKICPEQGGDHDFEVVSLDGRLLWNYRWDSHFIWPTSASSANGRRIAFSTLRVGHPVTAIDPIDETDLQGQRIEVLDAENGHLLLTQSASPMLSGGQNFALSPDGSQFAVLRENAIEIYALPPASGAADLPR